MSLFWTVIISAAVIVRMIACPFTTFVTHQLMCLAWVGTKPRIFELRYLIIWWILNRFYGPSDMSLEALSIKCRNLQMISNLSNVITEPKTGVAASWFRDKYRLTPGFCMVPFSTKSASTKYISSAVRMPLIYLQPLGEKYLPLNFLNCWVQRLGAATILCTLSLSKKLFKCVYSVSQALSTVLRSANSTKFSLPM